MHANHLKYSGPVFRKLLKLYFDNILAHGFLPEVLLHGEIRPILKDSKGCKSKLDNYRPVMNSSVLLKVFEYCLLPICEKELIPNDLQMGFRNAVSCNDTVSLFKEIISLYNSGGSSVYCAFIDLCKAFDTIDHSILINKLECSNLPSYVVRCLTYMIRNTHVHVTVNNLIGSSWKVKSGLRQGGILSGILFNYYIKDCIGEILKSNEGCTIGAYKTNIIAYADDIVLMCPSVNGLQKLVGSLGVMLKQIKLKVNVTKSRFMIFKRKSRDSFEHNLYLYGTPLERVYEFKYLGIILTDSSSNYKDSCRISSSFLRQFNAMYYKFSFADRNVLRFLFRSYCTAFYGMELHFDLRRKANLRPIAVAYHKAIKQICHLNRWDSNHYACELLNLDIFIHLQAKRMFNYCVSIMSARSQISRMLKYYLNFQSMIISRVRYILKVDYDIDDAFSNDSDAVLARIDFVQRNEPRSYSDLSADHSTQNTNCI